MSPIQVWHLLGRSQLQLHSRDLALPVGGVIVGCLDPPLRTLKLGAQLVAFAAVPTLVSGQRAPQLTLELGRAVAHLLKLAPMLCLELLSHALEALLVLLEALILRGALAQRLQQHLHLPLTLGRTRLGCRRPGACTFGEILSGPLGLRGRMGLGGERRLGALERARRERRALRLERV